MTMTTGCHRWEAGYYLATALGLHLNMSHEVPTLVADALMPAVGVILRSVGIGNGI